MINILQISLEDLLFFDSFKSMNINLTTDGLNKLKLLHMCFNKWKMVENQISMMSFQKQNENFSDEIQKILNNLEFSYWKCSLNNFKLINMLFN